MIYNYLRKNKFNENIRGVYYKASKEVQKKSV